MDVELSEFLQASKSERTAQRRGYRNGHREVTLKSSTLGRLELSVPRDRDGNFNSRLLEKCPRVERSMLIALAEGYTQGLSTRKVVALLNRLGLGDMSKSHLSRLRKKMDASLALTVNRPLRGECHECLMCDALYGKARVDGVARASACYIAIVIDGEGRRRLLALEVGDEESTANWSQVFQGLKRRGLGPVSYVVADQHAGLQEALGRELGSVAVQRCVFHWLHNAGTRLPQKQARAVLAQLSGFFNAQDIGQAPADPHVARQRTGAPVAAAGGMGGGNRGGLPGVLRLAGRTPQAHAHHQLARAGQPGGASAHQADAGIAKPAKPVADRRRRAD